MKRFFSGRAECFELIASLSRWVKRRETKWRRRKSLGDKVEPIVMTKPGPTFCGEEILDLDLEVTPRTSATGNARRIPNGTDRHERS